MYKEGTDVKKSLKEIRQNNHFKMELDWIQVALDGVRFCGLVT